LEEEGVQFQENGRIDLERYRWHPKARRGPKSLRSFKPRRTRKSR